MRPLHPSEVLVEVGRDPPLRPACEHYCGSPKKLRKALLLQATRGGDFDITVDLEDGAVVGDEQANTSALLSVVQSSPPAGGLGFRIHPLHHPRFADDLRALACELDHDLSWITIPKSSHASEASRAIDIASRIFRSAGRLQPPFQIMIETFGALEDCFEIARLPLVDSLSFGQMDFVSEHRGAIAATAMRSPGQFDHPLMQRAKAEVSAAAHSAGRLAVHNPTVDYANVEQTRQDAARAKALGFQRMWSIHPAQVEPILDAFQEDQAEIEDAALILLTAQAAAWGPIAHAGRLHDRASYRYYWRLLCQARLKRQALPAAAEAAFFAND